MTIEYQARVFSNSWMLSVSPSIQRRLSVKFEYSTSVESQVWILNISWAPSPSF